MSSGLGNSGVKVLKFGWTSLWGYDMIKKSSEIVLKSKDTENIIVVVSAMSWITNTLYELCDLVISWDKDLVSTKIDFIRNKHLDVISKLWTCEVCNQWIERINEIIWELEDIFKAMILLKQISNKAKAKILYFWEILSSILLSLFFIKEWTASVPYESKDYLISNWKYLDWECDIIASKEKLDLFMENTSLDNEIPIFTWFWWWNNNDVYLFDRWGSDYVATLLASIIEAKQVEIWTDASWVMTADPRKVNFPVIWDELDFEVASEFALSWAKILHPKSLSPVQKKNIPVFVKNTFNYSSPWTKICCLSWKKWIKWINISTAWVILTFIEPTMIWSPWFVYSVIKILEEENVSIDVMATTETSFSISICEKYFSNKLVEKLKNMEKHFKLVIEKDVCKISIVWDSIDTHKVLESIDDIIMISKWAYNKCLTIYAKSDNPDRLLRILHKDLFEV